MLLLRDRPAPAAREKYWPCAADIRIGNVPKGLANTSFD
jgi:hypothetical protein